MTVWDAGGWEGARRAQEEAWLTTTPAQRLAWLEEAVELVRAGVERRLAPEGSAGSSG